MQKITDFMGQNWEVLFSGIGVLAISVMWKFFLKKPDEQEAVANNFTNNVTINSGEKSGQRNGVDTVSGNDLSYYQDTTRILFIDDDKDFNVVKILKNAGWQNTSLIKDVKNLDQKEIVDSDILFIDIQGVGVALGFADEGLGVAQAIKERNPQKKVVIYSAQTHGERLHAALTMADSLLKKNADPYEFIQLVESFTVGG